MNTVILTVITLLNYQPTGNTVMINTVDPRNCRNEIAIVNGLNASNRSNGVAVEYVAACVNRH
jgi:hypothetical protein